MTAKGIGFLDGKKITGLFDYTDNLRIAFGIFAEFAGVIFREGEATGAKLNGAVQFHES
jgi:hypothetical protein